MKRTAADILLALLERVPDVNQVERLLDAPNLKTVLNAHGRSDADIKVALKSKMPGELLLDLLDEGHKPADLLAKLPEPRPGIEGRPAPPKPAPPPRPPAKRGALSDLPASWSRLNLVGGTIALCATVWPAMILAGFFPEWAVGTEGMWYGIAAGGAALGGLLFVAGRQPLWVGALSAALAAPGALFVLQWWSRQREELFHIELVAAVLVGTLPGLLIYRLLVRRKPA